MNWKNRLTNYNFWISIFSAVLLILQAFNIEFDIAYVNEIFTGVLGLLVMIGIVIDPTRTTSKTIVESCPKQDEKNVTTENVETENLTQEESQKEEQTVPIVEENEVNDVAHETDFQIILNKISTDLNEKVEILTEKFETLKNFNEKMLNEEETSKDLTNIKVDCVKELVEAPAVAEMDNPYLDVIN